MTSELRNAAPQPKVGAMIRARRRQLQLTLQEICDAAGISVGYLSQVERDHATPSLGTLAQIARSLDVALQTQRQRLDALDSLERIEGGQRRAKVAGLGVASVWMNMADISRV